MKELPQKKELMVATLEVMAKEDKVYSTSELNDLVAKYLQIPDDLLEIEDANFSGTEYSYRMRWVRTQLKQDGKLLNVKRGEWKLA